MIILEGRPNNEEGMIRLIVTKEQFKILLAGVVISQDLPEHPNRKEAIEMINDMAKVKL